MVSKIGRICAKTPAKSKKNSGVDVLYKKRREKTWTPTLHHVFDGIVRKLAEHAAYIPNLVEARFDAFPLGCSGKHAIQIDLQKVNIFHTLYFFSQKRNTS